LKRPPGQCQNPVSEQFRRLILGLAHGNDPGAKAFAYAICQCPPLPGGPLGEFRLQHIVKQLQPEWKMLGLHFLAADMHPHRIAAVTALAQDGIAPEACDLFLMFRPVLNVGGEHRAKNGMLPHAGIKGGDHVADLFGRDVKARQRRLGLGVGHGHSAMLDLWG